MIHPDDNHAQRKIVDNLVLDVTALRAVSCGVARYEITATLPHGREVLMVVRTARKGRISTSIDAGGEVLEHLRHAVSAEGALSLLETTSCSMHLEQMARGHYWLGISTDGKDTVHINFTTPGYLTVTAVERAAGHRTGA